MCKKLFGKRETLLTDLFWLQKEFMLTFNLVKAFPWLPEKSPYLCCAGYTIKRGGAIIGRGYICGVVKKGLIITNIDKQK